MWTGTDSIDQTKAFYQNQLFENVLPFWTQHSLDQKQGGFFTCLDRTGNVYDKDKFIWLQCRQVWMFAKLYNTFEARDEWLNIALHGANFLKKHGRDPQGHWYFSLTQTGQPLIQPYNIFSDCFAAMAFAQLYKATKKEEDKHIASETFAHILERKNLPKGKYTKAVPGTRPLKGFALPMILSNLVLEMESVLDPEMVESNLDYAVQEVMQTFYQEKWGILLESVTEEGNFSDSFEGRLFNPGHVLEAMWFMMDIGVRRKNDEIIQKACEIAVQSLHRGWDEKYGGIFYFLDILNQPPQQLEWDQKLWWVHLEALIACLKGYQLTGNTELEHWFQKIHHYTRKHFVDPEYGEWFGYLNRRGEVLLPLKGGKWKGCFHVPRGLYTIMNILKTLE